MLRQSFLIMTGYVMIGIGLVVLPLPVPLGIPMIAAGLAILVRASPKTKWQVRRWLIKLKTFKKSFSLNSNKD